LTTILHLFIVVSIISVTAPLLFSAPIPENWFYFILVFISLAFACAGLSVLIGVISPNSRMTVLWSQLIFVPSMILGGMMVPFSMMPDFAATFAQLLPAAQGMNAFNGLAMGKGAAFSPWGSVIALLLSGTLAFGLALYLFSWDRQNTTRRGHPLLALLVLLPYLIGMLLF